MAARMMRGSPAGAKPVPPRRDMRPTIPAPPPAIRPELLDALVSHARLHRDKLDVRSLAMDGERFPPISRILSFATEGEYTAREVIKLLARLDQRDALRTIMLHQALRWLYAAGEVLTAPGDASDDEIPF
ncbi:hypothetical protein FFK22_008950 [Mycobacterium sp. KBS0706]|uniref:hypothetical protein n=1 Tax=Mycobacterium sp. KBS0706 TaxID=2578109 RepID=UPI00110FCC25|nr:hypothetical protein [Mycobacterium sp. KBS0706]TSD89097.1 hypothetical protein FFK22_008950 [Mycobacterium sp. KBS0706]